MAIVATIIWQEDIERSREVFLPLGGSGVTSGFPCVLSLRLTIKLLRLRRAPRLRLNAKDDMITCKIHYAHFLIVITYPVKSLQTDSLGVNQENRGYFRP